jgi:WD40 repeat protein
MAAFMRMVIFPSFLYFFVFYLLFFILLIYFISLFVYKTTEWFGSLEWSPDEKYVAYIAEPSVTTSSFWDKDQKGIYTFLFFFFFFFFFFLFLFRSIPRPFTSLLFLLLT